jgi:hypothetical protein
MNRLMVVYTIETCGGKDNKKFWEKPVAYFPLIRHEPQRKRRLQQFFVVAGTSLTSLCLATIARIHVQIQN